MKISLVDTADGPKITIDYESEVGSAGYLHEKEHREAVATLLGLGAGDLAALGIAVERPERGIAATEVDREAAVVVVPTPIKTS